MQGLSNRDFIEEQNEFIPASPLEHAERAARRGHVVAFIGGVLAGIFVTLTFQRLTAIILE